MAELKNLERKDVDAAARVLARAFDGDPLMDAFFSESLLSPDEARYELFLYSCNLRLELGWPLLGVTEENRVCGVACISFSDRPEWPPTLEEIYRTFTKRIGALSAKKLEAYGGLSDDQRPEEPHHFVAVLGVDPQDHGRGFGRLLLEEVHRLAANHPSSIGVALDTENPQNLSFYEHFGYLLTAESTLNGVKIWHFFRPASADNK